jgi:hypothetical protein
MGAIPHKYNEDTDAFEPMTPNAIFVDRDKKEYPAIILKEYIVNIVYGGKNIPTERAKVAVNFGKKGKDDWRDIEGIGDFETTHHNPFGKQYFKRIKKTTTEDKKGK